MLGMAAKCLHTRARRASNARRIFSTHSWSPSRAARAAYWLMLLGLLVSWLWMLAIALTTWGGPIAQPMRQPVIAKLLLTPLIVMVRSARPGRRVAKHVARASPYTRRS